MKVTGLLERCLQRLYSQIFNLGIQIWFNRGLQRIILTKKTHILSWSDTDARVGLFAYLYVRMIAI